MSDKRIPLITKERIAEIERERCERDVSEATEEMFEAIERWYRAKAALAKLDEPKPAAPGKDVTA